VQVEELAARFFGAEAALVVASGYAGPSVLMQCAPQGFDLILLLVEPERRDRLRANADRLRRGLRRLGLAVADWPTGRRRSSACRPATATTWPGLQRELFERGLAIFHSRNYPGVGEEGALRIAVFATHTDAMIDRLLQEMAALL
jgi:8-amino-7-oxononanoate synthase